jgi:prevent-host-death family protein
MDVMEVSIAEGKRDFAKLIRASEEKRQKIIVSRRGRPVAVIVPYDQHMKDKKRAAMNKIQESRARYDSCGITAVEAFEASKRELEEKS